VWIFNTAPYIPIAEARGFTAHATRQNPDINQNQSTKKERAYLSLILI